MASHLSQSILLRDAEIKQPPAPLRALRHWLNRDAPIPATSPEDVRVFQPSEEGSGIFGRWILDGDGLPAYEYVLDQYAEPKATFPNTAMFYRR
jgi:hypothetical protein